MYACWSGQTPLSYPRIFFPAHTEASTTAECCYLGESRDRSDEPAPRQTDSSKSMRPSPDLHPRSAANQQSTHPCWLQSSSPRLQFRLLTGPVETLANRDSQRCPAAVPPSRNRNLWCVEIRAPAPAPLDRVDDVQSPEV